MCFECATPLPSLPLTIWLVASNAVQMFGDSFFTCPTRRLAQNYNATTYIYHFDHKLSWIVCPGPYCSKQKLGVYHSSELFFVWGRPSNTTSFTPDESKLSTDMIDAWTNFAISGDPKHGWPKYQNKRDWYLVLNTTRPLHVEFNYRSAYVSSQSPLQRT